MDTVQQLRDLFQAAHQFLEGTLGDLTPEQATWAPPGKAHNIAALYTHVVVGEDALVNGVIRHAAPLIASTWAGRT